MCSRYTASKPEEVSRRLTIKNTIEDGTEFKPIIYPGYQAPVIRLQNGNPFLESRFWGFVARFPGKKDPKALLEKILQNAVSETVNEKRTFSSAWKKGLRCLIPVQSFFEPKERKFIAIESSDQKSMMMAGLYTEVTYKDQKHAAFTMLTCAPNSFVSDFHDRMPVILHESEWMRWLSSETSPSDAQKLCRPYFGDLSFSE